MREFNLAYYLEDFRRLGELDEKDLQTLLKQYPFAQNLHLLKSKWDWVHKHQFSESNAIYATQRERFFQQIEQEVWEQFPNETLPIPSAIYLPGAKEATVVQEQIPPDTAENPAVPPVHDIIPDEPATDGPVLADETARSLPPTLDTQHQTTTDIEAIPSIKEGHEMIIDPTQELFAEEIAEHLAGVEEENIEAGSVEPITVEESVAEHLPLQTWEEPILPEKSESPVPQPDAIWDLLEEPWVETTTNHAGTEDEAILTSPIIDPSLPDAGNPFSQWLQRLSPVTPGLVQTLPKASARIQIETPPSAPFTSQPLQDAAAASNIMRDHIASETLADILARQGYKERAISIYEKLILTNPEKSNFFAEKIKKLKGS